MQYPPAFAPAEYAGTSYHRNTITKGAPPTNSCRARTKGAGDKPITEGAVHRCT